MYQQGYHPPQQSLFSNVNTEKQNRHRTIKRLTLIFVALMVILSVVFIFASPFRKTFSPDAEFIVLSLKAKSLPIGNIVEYDESTDPNNLLGRPGGYTSKASFSDLRLNQDGDTPIGGTIEVFDNNNNAKNRFEYTTQFNGTILGSYCYLNNNALLRIDYKLSADQAGEYQKTLDEILEMNEGEMNELIKSKASGVQELRSINVDTFIKQYNSGVYSFRTAFGDSDAPAYIKSDNNRLNGTACDIITASPLDSLNSKLSIALKKNSDLVTNVSQLELTTHENAGTVAKNDLTCLILAFNANEDVNSASLLANTSSIETGSIDNFDFSYNGVKYSYSYKREFLFVEVEASIIDNDSSI